MAWNNPVRSPLVQRQATGHAVHMYLIFWNHLSRSLLIQWLATLEWHYMCLIVNNLTRPVSMHGLAILQRCCMCPKDQGSSNPTFVGKVANCPEVKIHELDDLQHSMPTDFLCCGSVPYRANMSVVYMFDATASLPSFWTRRPGFESRVRMPKYSK